MNVGTAEGNSSTRSCGGYLKPGGGGRPVAARRDLPAAADAAVRGREGERRGRQAAGDAAPAGSARRSATISSDRPIPGVMMSGGRKPVQDGVRVKLSAWRDLGRSGGDEPERDSRSKACCRPGFLPLPHVKQRDRRAGVSRRRQIDEIRRQEAPQPAALRRRLRSAGPSHAGVSAADLPHAPVPSSATSRAGKLLTIRNFYALTGRDHHAGADGGPAAAADAVPAGGVQPDRGPQGAPSRASASPASTATPTSTPTPPFT